MLLVCLLSSAQWSSLRSKQIKLQQNEVLSFDSLTVDPEYLLVPGFQVDKDFNFRNDSLIWLAPDMVDSVTIYYRNVHISKLYRNKDPKLIQQVYQENPFNYIPEKDRLNSNFGKLSTSGNISRGIGFGNAQDIVVNSNLNLRISGLLPNDVEVLAAISDENNPIQPEGNTQQIQDFDQVYITLRKDSTTLTVGDFLMQRPSQSYFVNYYKKSRGIQLNTIKYSGELRTEIQAEAAISRGRFSRNQIDGIDGNSGPYRLSGSNGEIFIIVIAGTEKLYLDGRLLERGEDNDYVINYNSGEITFTPKILITRYSRIVVEFQYSDRNYARSVLHTGASVGKKRWTVYANYFNEMDLKNQPFQQSLNGFDSSSGLTALELLRAVGDQNASIPNVNATPVFNPDRIMYRRIDSLGQFIYVYTGDPKSDTVFYEVSFTNVGFGNGSYIQVKSAANGKVFEYIGDGQGDYLPVELLIAPKKLNMFNLGVQFRTKSTESGLELSVSQYDQNTFSPINDDDNSGYGVKLYRKSSRMLKDSSWKFSNKVDYELVSNGFNYVERYRSVEFNRQWNKIVSNPDLVSSIINSFEHIANAGIEFKQSPNRYFSSSLSTYIKPTLFNGINWNNAAAYGWKHSRIGTSVDYLQSEDRIDSNTLSNEFTSWQAFAEQDVWNLVIGAKNTLESSIFKLGDFDSLTASTYAFNQTELFLRDNGEGKLRYQFTVGQRNDSRVKDESLQTATIGKDLTASVSYMFENYDKISIQTAYRDLEIIDSSFFTGTPQNTLQSRLELDLSFIQQLIKTKTFIQVGTGQEQRREFQYLQVQAGNGIYIWNDYDSNGVKTLDEFEIASDFDKSRADYIKIFTPVAGFITSRLTKISETFEINPAALFRSKNAKPNLISKFYSLSTLLFEQKSLPESGKLVEFGNNELGDTNLLNRSSSFRTTLFYNRSNPKFGMDYSFLSNQSKILLTNGFDARSSIENKLNIRVNIKRLWTIRTAFINGAKEYSSEFFGIRNYNYQYIEVQPKVQLQLSNTFRFEIRTSYYEAVNGESYGGETADKLELGTGIKFTKASASSFQADFSYVKVNYNGEVGTTLGYELLRGLQDGNNATWNINYQQRLANSIQIVLSYDGRKSETAPVIHIGRLVARYLF